MKRFILWRYEGMGFGAIGFEGEDFDTLDLAEQALAQNPTNKTEADIIDTRDGTFPAHFRKEGAEWRRAVIGRCPAKTKN